MAGFILFTLYITDSPFCPSSYILHTNEHIFSGFNVSGLISDLVLALVSISMLTISPYKTEYRYKL